MWPLKQAVRLFNDTRFQMGDYFLRKEFASSLFSLRVAPLNLGNNINIS